MDELRNPSTYDKYWQVVQNARQMGRFGSGQQTIAHRLIAALVSGLPLAEDFGRMSPHAPSQELEAMKHFDPNEAIRDPGVQNMLITAALGGLLRFRAPEPPPFKPYSHYEESGIPGTGLSFTGSQRLDRRKFFGVRGQGQRDVKLGLPMKRMPEDVGLDPRVGETLDEGMSGGQMTAEPGPPPISFPAVTRDELAKMDMENLKRHIANLHAILDQPGHNDMSRLLGHGMLKTAANELRRRLEGPAEFDIAGELGKAGQRVTENQKKADALRVPAEEGATGPIGPIKVNPDYTIASPSEFAMHLRGMSDMDLLAYATRTGEKPYPFVIQAELRRRGIIPSGTRF